MARQKRKKQHQTKTPQTLPLDGESGSVLSSRHWQWLVIVLLLLFGVYQVVIYYQHQPVPSSDFVAFANTSRPLLHFELPRTMKRVPMLGLLHIAVGAICPGPHPELTAGWLLNGLFHALSVVLFYRVAKHLLGPPAFFFAILASVNPWLLQLSCDPIAETAIIFFTLLTFDLMLRRSRWCYLIAMVASMIRYECAALIAIAFFVDMALCKPKKEKLYALLYAFLASLPMGLWLLATKLTWSSGSRHYIGHFVGTPQRIGFKYWDLLWDTAFSSLVQIPSWVAAVFGKLKIASQGQADQIRHSTEVLSVAIRIVTGIGFVGALAIAAIRKNWKFWALFAFWGAYVGVHSIRHVTEPRYTVPVMWLTLLIAFYGLQCLGKFLADKLPAIRLLAIAGYSMVAATCLIWIAKLAPVLPATAPRSKNSTSLVYVSVSVVLIYLVMQWWTQQKRDVFKSVACLSVCGLLLVSNQFQVVRMLGNGGKDAEFKMLAEWYVKNAQPGEKMTTTMPGTVKLFVPDKQNILFTSGGKTFPEFIQSCYKRNVTYVVWDSRIGLSPNDSYYKSWNIQKMAPLAQAKDVGPFEFVERIGVSKRRYLHIFKLRPLSSFPPAIQEQLKPKPPTPKQP